MSFAQTVAWIALAYLVVPLVVYLAYILWKRMRRSDKGEGEGDAEA